jgi:hypothetical protein
VAAPPALGASKNGPDLASRSIKGKPKALAPGTRFTVKVKVRNGGNRKAGKSTLYLYLGLKARHSRQDFRIGRARVRAIRPHRSKVVKVRAKLPAIAARTLAPGSYRLIACVDALHKVKERNERNDCRAERGSLKLRAGGQTGGTGPNPGPAPGGSTPNQAGLPAFAIADGISWSRGEDAADNQLAQDDPVPVTLIAANDFPGQAGYTRTEVPSESVPAGSATKLSFSSDDDGSAQVDLPFTFAFGGIPYTSAFVSTNGYVSFGDAAPDYFQDARIEEDFRGVDALAGNFYRGLMPFWSDLKLVSGSSVADPAVNEIVAPGNASVTFQWHVTDCCGPADPERNISVTLFPDGSFRYDYGSNPDGSNDGFVGYSAGNGSLDDFVSKTLDVPTTGLLYTPKALPGAGTLAAGTITGSIPRGTTASGLDPGCTVTTAPTGSADGVVTCSVPALAPGQSSVRHYSWSNSRDEMANLLPSRDYSATYTPAGGAAVSDRDEFGIQQPYRANSPTQAAVAYVGPASPTVGDPMTFSVRPQVGVGNTALFNPLVDISIPDNTTLDSVEVEGLGHAYSGCLPPTPGNVRCLLPIVDTWNTLDVTVTPTADGVFELTAQVDADNAGTKTLGQASSPSVAP